MIFSPGKQPENQKKSHVIETEFQPGLKSRKQYGCRWEAEAISVELGDKRENLIRCLSNFKAQIEYQNIDFTADKG